MNATKEQSLQRKARIVSIVFLSFILFILASCSSIGSGGQRAKGASVHYYSDGFTRDFVSQSKVPSGYVPVTTIDDLYAIRYNPGGKYILMNDLGFSIGETWEPIDGFSGILDGNGYVLHGLRIDTVGKNCGLFSSVSNATVKNIGLENVYFDVENGRNVGAIAGVADGTTSIVNCYVTGIIAAWDGKDFEFGKQYVSNDAKMAVGGIVGKAVNDATSIINCYNAADVSAVSIGSLELNVGGISGKCFGAVYGCSNRAFVAAAGNFLCSRVLAGGITGLGLHAVSCYNTGEISVYRHEYDYNKYVRGTADTYAGGIVGSTDISLDSENYYYLHAEFPSTILNCFNSGSVFANSECEDELSWVGGIAGNLTDASIKCCYNAGSILDPYSNSNTGEIVGDYSESGCSIANCYYSSALEDSATYSGAKFPFVNNIELSGMEDEKSYTGFDFGNTWFIASGGFPFPQLVNNPLRGNEEALPSGDIIGLWYAMEDGKVCTEESIEFRNDGTVVLISEGDRSVCGYVQRLWSLSIYDGTSTLGDSEEVFYCRVDGNYLILDDYSFVRAN